MEIFKTRPILNKTNKQNWWVKEKSIGITTKIG